MRRVWLHLTATTYGTWLRGDPRSFRTRHHREHVIGDYKNPPPPGTYDALHRYSKSLMTRPPVSLSPDARALACTTIVEALSFHHCLVHVACVTEHHAHNLAAIPIPETTPSPQTPPSPQAQSCGSLTPAPASSPKPTGSRLWALNPQPRKDNDELKSIARHLMGIAKSRSARILSQHGLTPTRGIWGKRGRPTRVRDRAHFNRIERYILDHAEQGAFIWRANDHTQ